MFFVLKIYHRISLKRFSKKKRDKRLNCGCLPYWSPKLVLNNMGSNMATGQKGPKRFKKVSKANWPKLKHDN